MLFASGRITRHALMQRLRSTWGMRILAVLLSISLVPAIAAPLAEAAQPSQAPFYADWLRAQLDGEPSPALDAAIEEAAAGHARSIEAFLVDFVQAFEAGEADVSLMDVFPIGESSREALIRYLYSRYGQTLGDVPMPTATLESTASPYSAALGRVVAMLPRTGAELTPAIVYAPALTLENLRLVFPVRLSWAARPLGP